MARRKAENSNKTTKGTVGRPFEKGQSGNPGGRPKIPEEVKQAFQDLTPVAVAKLKEIIESKNTKDTDRIKAIDIVLDRGLGKPLQQVDVDAHSIPKVVFMNEQDLPE